MAESQELRGDAAALAASRARSDRIAKLLGDYLLRGWRMLATQCPVCDAILVQNVRARPGSAENQPYCIGCNEVDAPKAPDAVPAAEAPAQGGPSPALAPAPPPAPVHMPAQEVRPPPDLVSGSAAVGAPGGPAAAGDLAMPLPEAISLGIDRRGLVATLEHRLMAAKRALEDLPAEADLQLQVDLVRLITACCQGLHEARRL